MADSFKDSAAPDKSIISIDRGWGVGGNDFLSSVISSMSPVKFFIAYPIPTPAMPIPIPVKAIFKGKLNLNILFLFLKDVKKKSVFRIDILFFRKKNDKDNR